MFSVGTGVGSKVGMTVGVGVSLDTSTSCPKQLVHMVIIMNDNINISILFDIMIPY
jgi:hypothetical protein